MEKHVFTLLELTSMKNDFYFFSHPVRPMPFHMELATYFHSLVDIYGRSDAEPGDYSTTFGLSTAPFYSVHLGLQRAHDDRIPRSCAATLLPPALRPSLQVDRVAQYHLMAQDERFAHLAFPDLNFEQEIPPETLAAVRNTLNAEHAAFIDHL